MGYRVQDANCLFGWDKVKTRIEPGQEKYRVYGVHFYRSAEGIIVVYYATRQET